MERSSFLFLIWVVAFLIYVALYLHYKDDIHKLIKKNKLYFLLFCFVVLFVSFFLFGSVYRGICALLGI